MEDYASEEKTACEDKDTENTCGKQGQDTTKHVRPEELLRQKYPDILNHGYEKATFYMDIPQGWYDLVERLLQVIDAVYQATGVCAYPAQIKSKFGTLRFYATIKPDLHILETRPHRFNRLRARLLQPLNRLMDTPAAFKWLPHHLYLITRRYLSYVYRPESMYLYYRGDIEVPFCSVRRMLSDIISAAENESSQICEECGEAGSERKKYRGWLYTVCPKHAEELDKAEKEAERLEDGLRCTGE
jgi:hypothetical protein